MLNYTVLLDTELLDLSTKNFLALVLVFPATLLVFSEPV